MEANESRLNPDKAEVLLVGSSSCLGTGGCIMPTLVAAALVLEPSVRSLVVLLDSSCLLNVQIVEWPGARFSCFGC